MARKIGFLIVWTVYILMFLADLISTLSLGQIGRVLESNIAYKYIGFTGIIILNFGIIWLLWWVYSRPNTTPSARFYFIMLMLMVISIRVYALGNAVDYINNPVTLEQAVQIATPEAKMETAKQVVSIAYPPIIFAVIGFLFWKLDHKLERRD